LKACTTRSTAATSPQVHRRRDDFSHDQRWFNG
jgi:hypothetical protein